MENPEDAYHPDGPLSRWIILGDHAEDDELWGIVDKGLKLIKLVGEDMYNLIKEKLSGTPV